MSKLVLLSLPIGNVKDLTVRVREALEMGQNFLVEDTRVFRALLSQLEISSTHKSINSFHDHSSEEKLEAIITGIQNSEHPFYLCSDAGSPLISDPAYPLVRKALTAGLEIDSYAGVSAPLMALELSGLAPIPFTFHGFLPRDKGPRTKYLQNLAKGTHIFFEGVSRVADTLKILGAVHPNAPMAVARELSKTFQTMHYFMGSNVSEMLPDVTLKGEFVLLVEVQEEVQDFELQELAKEVLSKGGQSKSLSKLLAKILKTHSKEVYQELNRQK